MLLAAAVELFVREQFYRMSIEVPALVQVLTFWLILTCSVLLATRSTERRVRSMIFIRICVLLAVAVSIWVLLPLGTVMAGWPGWFQWPAGALLGIAGWQLARKTSAMTWRRLQLAFCTGSLLFVCVQPVLVAARAPRLSWPAWPKTVRAKPTDGTPKSAQIFLLLDELNASAAGPIVAALQRSHLDTRLLSLSAAGNGTAKVVPAMFSGGDFERAKPCGPASTCGSTDVLDFSNISVSRNDVDVVGFYMPYCAMRGLRFCGRATLDAPLLDWRLWACAAFHRVGHFPPTNVEQCAALQRGRWQRLREDVESSMWQAPIWRRGGFLYAHLPLPHPPAGGRSASLKQDYEANVAEAARLVERIVATARGGGIDSLSIVIFSDHPLRPWHFCNDPVYLGHPCKPDDGLKDTLVPLIVAGDLMPDTQSIHSNREIFSLIPSVPSSSARQP